MSNRTINITYPVRCLSTSKLLPWVGFVITSNVGFLLERKTYDCASLTAFLWMFSFEFSVNNVRINFYTGIFNTVHLIAASGGGAARQGISEFAKKNFLDSLFPVPLFYSPLVTFLRLTSLHFFVYNWSLFSRYVSHFYYIPFISSVFMWRHVSRSKASIHNVNSFHVF